MIVKQKLSMLSVRLAFGLLVTVVSGLHAFAQQPTVSQSIGAPTNEVSSNRALLVLVEYSLGEGITTPRIPQELHKYDLRIRPLFPLTSKKLALTADNFESEVVALNTLVRIQRHFPNARIGRRSEFEVGANEKIDASSGRGLSTPASIESNKPSIASETKGLPKFRQLIGEVAPTYVAKTSDENTNDAVTTQLNSAGRVNYSPLPIAGKTDMPKYRQLLGELAPTYEAKRNGTSANGVVAQQLKPVESVNSSATKFTDQGDMPRYSQPLSEASVQQFSEKEAKAKPSLTVELSTSQASANGLERIAITVRIPEQGNSDVSGRTVVNVSISGSARLIVANEPDDDLHQRVQRDVRNATSTLQLQAKNGEARFWVIAPSVPEEALLRVQFRDQVAEGPISFVPELREFVAVGLVEGIISGRSLSSNAIQPLGSRSGFEEDLRRWSKEFDDGQSSAAGRAAMFIKGTISGDALLTASYDSDKITHSRLLRDIDPQLEYPVYGDSSQRGFDARSASPLYVRIDKNKSYVLWGDFSTNDSAVQVAGKGINTLLVPRKIGAYGRVATGLRVHDESSSHAANAFVTYDSLRNRVEQYPLNGTSILPGLGSSEAIVNSEQIFIVTYDRNMRSTVLSQRLLERFRDYVFEPFNGRIRLLGSDLSYADDQGNPRYLRVSYEVENKGGKEFLTYGADGQLEVGTKLSVGGSVVKDENPQQPYQLASANAKVQLTPRSSGVVEVAQSESTGIVQANGRFVPGSIGLPGTLESRQDGAVRVELQHEGEGWEARLQAQKAGAGFYNPTIDSGAGRTEALGSVKVRVTDTVTATLDATHLQDDIQAGTPSRDDIAMGVTVKVSEALQLRAGVRHVQESALLANTPLLPPNYGTSYGAGAISNGTTDPGLSGNIGTGLTNGLSGSIPITRDVDAVTLRVGADWKPDNAWQLGAEIEGGTDTLRSQQVSRWMLSSNYRFNDLLRGIARYERSDGLGSALSVNQGDRSDVFTAGLRADVGAQTQVYSEYRLRDAISGETLEARDMQLASGVRQGYYLAPGVQLNGNAEYLKIYQGDGREAFALGVGLDHTANPLWKLSSRLDWRHIMDSGLAVGDQSEDQYSWTISFARKMDREWTYLVRNYLLLSNYQDDALGSPRGDTVQNRFQMGFAWRPVDTNPWNALIRYEYRTSWDDSVALLPPSNGALQATGVGDHYRAHIFSLVGDYHPSRPWWWTGRIAAMAREDRIPETGSDSLFSAYLMSSRLTYDYSKRWDISGLAAQLYSPESGNSQYALGIELGYLIQANLRLGLGYNVNGFSAPDLSGSDYTQSGWYLRLSIKFDEKLFKSTDPEINRSLARESTTVKP